MNAFQIQKREGSNDWVCVFAGILDKDKIGDKTMEVLYPGPKSFHFMHNHLFNIF